MYFGFQGSVRMEESLGPELRDLLIDTYISSICDECDDLYYETLHELMMLQCEEVEDSDDEEEEIEQEILLLKYLLLEVSPVCYEKVLMSTQIFLNVKIRTNKKN